MLWWAIAAFNRLPLYVSLVRLAAPGMLPGGVSIALACDAPGAPVAVTAATPVGAGGGSFEFSAVEASQPMLGGPPGGGGGARALEGTPRSGGSGAAGVAASGAGGARWCGCGVRRWHAEGEPTDEVLAACGGGEAFAHVPNATCVCASTCAFAGMYIRVCALAVMHIRARFLAVMHIRARWGCGYAYPGARAGILWCGARALARGPSQLPTPNSCAR